MKKLAAVFVLSALPFSAAAVDYTVKPREGSAYKCLQNEKRVSNAKFCHNCRNSGGNRVVWEFRVYCEGQSTEKLVRSVLDCGRRIPDEGEQRKMLQSQAIETVNENLDPWFWEGCDLGGWK